MYFSKFFDSIHRKIVLGLNYTLCFQEKTGGRGIFTVICCLLELMPRNLKYLSDCAQMSTLITDVGVLLLGFSFIAIKSAETALKIICQSLVQSPSRIFVNTLPWTSPATVQHSGKCSQCHHVWLKDNKNIKLVPTKWTGYGTIEKCVELGWKLDLTHCCSEG